jgi:pyruvate,water dikinase
MGIIAKLSAWRRRLSGEPGTDPTDYTTIFRAHYVSFKELLSCNTELLNIISDLEEKLHDSQVFGMAYIRSHAERAVLHTMRMVQCLNFIAGQKYLSLLLALQSIENKIKVELGTGLSEIPVGYVLTYDQINRQMVDWVGGKSANLGEVHSTVKIPTPDGFAITTRAYQDFFRFNDLAAAVARHLVWADPQQPESVDEASRAIQELIRSASMPADLVTAITSAWEQMASRRSSATPLTVAMRSSAIGEDAELTYAGQYRSQLNVAGDQILEAYRDIVASLYTPRAMIYRLTKGVRDEDIAMGVACLEMVAAVASGVIYTQDPTRRQKNRLIINAVWGLGPYAVDGRLTPDTYLVSRQAPHGVLESHIPAKPVQLVMDPGRGLAEMPVPENKAARPCLTEEQVCLLAEAAMRLEAHYGNPQDIEWALEPGGRLLVLQTRPLPLCAEPAAEADAVLRRPKGATVLAEKAVVVFAGVGVGPAVHVDTDADLMHFPEGGVLVAKRSSPQFMLAMPRARAIVAEVGSVTGHMASLAREFKVPTILDAKGAFSAIAPGQVITVDAQAGIVYAGRIQELIEQQADRPSSLQQTPVHQTLRRVADWIVPLNLVDPKSPDFTAENCRTLHDIMRMVHELSYQEMFRLSDLVSYREGAAVKLDAKLPIDLHLIDLGGGLNVPEKRILRKVAMDQISCAPLLALLKGMTHAELSHPAPRPIEFSGFLAVMREQMLSSPQHAERFGDRSYAIISDKYLNFSSRVGYHYSVLDAYCGQTVSKNYITFSFKGGAADDVRRNRRARAIAAILKAYDFSVKVRSDRVDARLLKYERPVILDKLDHIGRLLQFTRQMDMLMKSEAAVEGVAKSFLEGNYGFSPQIFNSLPAVEKTPSRTG